MKQLRGAKYIALAVLAGVMTACSCQPIRPKSTPDMVATYVSKFTTGTAVSRTETAISNIQTLVGSLTPPTPSTTPYPTYTPLPTYTPFPSPTATRTSTPRRYPTYTPRPTYTDYPTYTPFPTNTSTNTVTPTPTNTPTATLTNTPTKTSTLTPTATKTLTQTYTLTPTLTASPTLTATATQTRTATPTQTRTLTQSPTFTFTPTQTYTSTLTPTFTSTSTSTLTPTPTHTNTLTPTYTLTPTLTNTNTPTPTYTLTFTPTLTNSPTYTLTPTPTPTSTKIPAEYCLWRSQERVYFLDSLTKRDDSDPQLVECFLRDIIPEKRIWVWAYRDDEISDDTKGKEDGDFIRVGYIDKVRNIIPTAILPSLPTIISPTNVGPDMVSTPLPQMRYCLGVSGDEDAPPDTEDLYKVGCWLIGQASEPLRFKVDYSMSEDGTAEKMLVGYFIPNEMLPPVIPTPEPDKTFLDDIIDFLLP